MKYLRHDFTENIYSLPTGLRESMILDELSKLINLSHKGTIDAIKISGVDIVDNASKEVVAKVLCENWNNLKLRNKISKMLILVNARTENDDFVNFDGEIGDSVREVMSKGKKHLEKYKEKINDVSFALCSALKLKSSNKIVQNNITEYDNFGSTYKPKAGLKHTIKESDSNGSWSYLAIVGVLGLATLFYYKV
jgi:hypothetical protein